MIIGIQKQIFKNFVENVTFYAYCVGVCYGSFQINLHKYIVKQECAKKNVNNITLNIYHMIFH